MKKKYPNREVTINKDDPDEVKNAKILFNRGEAELPTIIHYWNYFKDCDLTYVLANDPFNTTKVTDQEVKNFMKEFRQTASVITNNLNIYEIIVIL